MRFFGLLSVVCLTAMQAVAAPTADAAPAIDELVAREPALFTKPAAASCKFTREQLDKFVFGMTMEQFLAAKAAKNPPELDWSDNGCSVPILGQLDPETANNPDGFPFLKSCQRHDFGYRNYKKCGFCGSAQRKKIDDQFKVDLGKVCASVSGGERKEDCTNWQNIYYSGVRLGGGLFSFC